nr:uncharacterized protein LOC123280065 [Equus asinus]
MESSSQAPWSSVSGEQEERELKEGLLRLAAMAVEGPGCCTQRGHGRRGDGGARPWGEQQSEAGLRQGRLCAGRRLPGWRPSSRARSPRSPPPTRSQAAAPSPLGSGTKIYM